MQQSFPDTDTYVFAPQISWKAGPVKAMIRHMNFLNFPTLILLLVISAAVTTPLTAQQKRRTQDKPPAKAPAAPTPAPAPPTFDTLLAADSYKIYAEVRGVGQLIRSGAVNDVLEPVLKFGGPPKDFLEFVNWLKAHADQLTSSRLLMAAWPNFKDVPDVVVAIEFSSPEEAAKFEKPLDTVMPTLLPPTTPQTSPEPDKKAQAQSPATERKPPEPVPGYYLQRAGSLLIVSPGKVELKKLKPPASKLMSEDANFRVAYNRFASEPIFLFIDFQAIEKERAEEQKRFQEEIKKTEAERKARAAKLKAEAAQTPEVVGPAQMSNEQTVTVATGPVGVFSTRSTGAPQTATQNEPSEAEAISVALSSIGYSLSTSRTEIPDALGIGFSPDNDSFDLRALIIDAPDKPSNPIPFLSALRFAGPTTLQSASVLPADSEIVLTMSLDYAQMYDRMMAGYPSTTVLRGVGGAEVPVDVPGPFARIEKLLKIKIKDDVVPLLGPEIAVSLPLQGLNPFSPPTAVVAVGSAKDAAKDETKEMPTPRSPVVVISLRDKEAMKLLLPKLLEGFAGKAATSLAQTERREDTELVSYANMFAYAFVGNFLVLSTDAASTRHVVDSYLKGETLASDVQFRNYTRWQPRELQGQAYVSPVFVDGYKAWAINPNVYITDEARAFFTRLAATAQPITYALSNDGFGTLHELHIPKSIVLLAVATASTSETPPETVKNERQAMLMMWTISSAEQGHKILNKSATGYASLEKLIEEKLIPKERLEGSGYKFELNVSADGFEISAVPVEYGKTGKLSYFIDQTHVLRGADHGGAAANASDPPIK